MLLAPLGSVGFDLTRKDIGKHLGHKFLPRFAEKRERDVLNRAEACNLRVCIIMRIMGGEARDCHVGWLFVGSRWNSYTMAHGPSKGLWEQAIFLEAPSSQLYITLLLFTVQDTDACFAY